jgi:hypothetical protein
MPVAAIVAFALVPIANKLPTEPLGKSLRVFRLGKVSVRA